MGSEMCIRDSLFPGFSHETEQALLDYQWPGNIRELKNVIERAIYRMDDVEKPIDEIVFDPFVSPWRPVSNTPDTTEQISSSKQANSVSEPEWPLDLGDEVAQLEVRRIEQALQQAHYHQNEAAKLLGLTYHQFRGLLRKYDISPKKVSADHA